MMHELPNHIAIILDGKIGRWAECARPAADGGAREARALSVRRGLGGARARGREHDASSAFSVANWLRPKAEVDALMRICAEFAEGEHRRGAGRARRGVVVAAGELEDLPTRTRRAIEQLVADTAQNDRMTLALAVNYGGRRDVVSAMKTLAARARAGLVIPEEIDESTLRAYLTTGAMPDPDLGIRPGGERRLSDFLLFECAHAELFFTETLWPDFDASTLDEALAAFSRRRRRVRVAAV